MSDKFIVKELNKRSAAFGLDNDVMAGFKTAVNNGQLRLALEYLTYIVDILSAEPAADPKPSMEKKAVAKEATAKAE